MTNENSNDDASNSELDNDEDGAEAEVAKRAIHSKENIGEGLDECEEDADKLLHSIQEDTLRFNGLIDLDDVCANKKLNDHSGSDNG